MFYVWQFRCMHLELRFLTVVLVEKDFLVSVGRFPVQYSWRFDNLVPKTFQFYWKYHQVLRKSQKKWRKEIIYLWRVGFCFVFHVIYSSWEIWLELALKLWMGGYVFYSVFLRILHCRWRRVHVICMIINWVDVNSQAERYYYFDQHHSCYKESTLIHNRSNIVEPFQTKVQSFFRRYRILCNLIVWGKRLILKSLGYRRTWEKFEETNRYVK